MYKILRLCEEIADHYRAVLGDENIVQDQRFAASAQEVEHLPSSTISTCVSGTKR
jgi:hypothetical protein